MTSTCTISFTRNDLSRPRLRKGMCPVKYCSADVRKHKVPFQKYKGEMKFLPFCPEHGIRIHGSGFVYYNGPSRDQRELATRRNLMFQGDYYLANFFESTHKMESSRLCYESSEDAVTYNVFTELLRCGALRHLLGTITGRQISDEVQLYLWGGLIDLTNNGFNVFEPLDKVRDFLEGDIRRFRTEPDIILVVPGKLLVCIEAKFGGGHPIARGTDTPKGEKPKRVPELIDRYCTKNRILDLNEVFDLKQTENVLGGEKQRKPFYEQLFRNIVFAASMSKEANIQEWFVASLEDRHVRYVEGRKPFLRNMKAILRRQFKKQFLALEWEDIYEDIIAGSKELANLAWYMKTKSLNCGRAFNCLS